MLRAALQGYRRVIRRPAFRRFWLGMMISRAGDAFTVVALSWVVLGIAGPVQLGLVVTCFGLLRFAADLAVAAVLLGLATFAWGPYYVFARTLMQRLVPGDVRSRVAGAQLTVTSLGFPLGSAVGGAVTGGSACQRPSRRSRARIWRSGCCRCSRRRCARP